MNTTKRGIKVTNYTCYLTEDLVSISNQVESVVSAQGICKEFFVDTYARTEKPKKKRWSKGDLSYTKYTSSPTEVRIVSTACLEISPVEELARCEDTYPAVPEEMLCEVINAIARRYGNYSDTICDRIRASNPGIRLRYGTKPEVKKPLAEPPEDRARRLLKSKAGDIRYKLSSIQGKTKDLRRMATALNKYAKRIVIDPNELDITLKNIDSMYEACRDAMIRAGE